VSNPTSAPVAVVPYFHENIEDPQAWRDEEYF